MKNILIILSSLILYSCGENKVDTQVERDEDQLVVGQALTVDNEAAKVALDQNTYYIVLITGDTIFTNDPLWKQYSPPVDTTPVINQPPVANAGADKTITLPTTSVSLAGFGNDPEGSKVTYLWVKVSGVGGTITNPTSATTAVTGLTAGSYSFRLAATDDKGAKGTDDVTVNVSPVVTSGIQGYGAMATGGEGKLVTRITNLSQLSSSIGSNKTILIDVSGTTGSFSISGVSNLTIDAYSTKQDVTIQGGGSDGLSIENSKNVIIRGLRFKGFSNDGLNTTGSSSNIVFDHCSSYDNGDGNIDLVATASTGKNFTVQWCIMGKNRGTGNMLITTQNASVHHNLFVGDGQGEGAERNPFAHSNYSPKGTSTSPNFDFRNNLVHASGSYASGCGYGAVGNFVNNYYTSNKSGLINLCADKNSCSKAHVSGNYNQPSPSGGSSSSEYSVPAQYKIAMTDATTAAKAVLASAGPYKRDSYEQGVINSIKIGTTTPPPVEPPPATGYTLVYQTGYDDLNSIDPFGNNQWGSDSKANHLSTTIYHTAPGSFKSLPVGNVSSGVRSEVQYGDAQTPIEGLIDYWVNYNGFPSSSMHSIQFHPSTSGGSGTGFYHVGNRKFDFVSVEQGTSGTHYPINYIVPLNQWIHIQWYYKFGNSGYSKIVIDGVTVSDVQNKKIGDGSRPYLKIGQNIFGNITPQAVYYDDLKIYKKD